MARYTLEDIELVRRMSGITYEEAIALLDLHGGNVGQALDDLRRSGRVNRTDGGDPVSSKKGEAGESVWQKLYAARVTLRKGDKVVLNVSSLCAGVTLLVSPHLVLGGAIASLALGYRFGFKARDEAFVKDSIGDMVKATAEKVRTSVDHVAQTIRRAAEEAGASSEAEEKEEVMDRQAYPPENRDYPVLRVPVKVTSPDGSVSVTKDGDGFTSATIE